MEMKADFPGYLLKFQRYQPLQPTAFCAAVSVFLLIKGGYVILFYLNQYPIRMFLPSLTEHVLVISLGHTAQLKCFKICV